MGRAGVKASMGTRGLNGKVAFLAVGCGEVSAPGLGPRLTVGVWGWCRSALCLSWGGAAQKGENEKEENGGRAASQESGRKKKEEDGGGSASQEPGRKKNEERRGRRRSCESRARKKEE